MELKKRNEMNPAYQWDLTPIYPDRAAWRDALADAEAAVKKLECLPGTLSASAEGLKAGLDAIYAAMEKAEKVYTYAFFCKSGDGGDPEFQEMEARAMSLLVNLEMVTAFTDPEILSIPEEKLNAWAALPELKPYRHRIEDVARSRAHTLDAQGERLLAMLGEAAQTPGNAFDMFESVDMKLPAVTGEAGEKVQLTHGGFSVLRESRDARVDGEDEAYGGDDGDQAGEKL